MRGVVVAAVVIVANCAPQVQTRELSGAFEYGFEHNAFYLNGAAHRSGDEAWCLSSASVERLGLSRPPANHIAKLQLTVRGDVSPLGRYGHMGLCEREIRVQRIVESRPIMTDCPGMIATCRAEVAP